MRITGVASTGLFTGSAGRPPQVIRVTITREAGDPPSATLRLGGAGIAQPPGRAGRDDHRREAGLDDVDGQPLPLRPGTAADGG
jgi:hypothetical protein